VGAPRGGRPRPPPPHDPVRPVHVTILTLGPLAGNAVH
jgi:hypothetical protein